MTGAATVDSRGSVSVNRNTRPFALRPCLMLDKLVTRAAEAELAGPTRGGVEQSGRDIVRTPHQLARGIQMSGIG